MIKPQLYHYFPKIKLHKKKIPFLQCVFFSAAHKHRLASPTPQYYGVRSVSLF